ncbi:MAG: hypothetical protein LUQ07_08920 [Methanospirillum sp.]|nr:hypothetical protein [Methanospirillum sp.]
MSDIMSMVISPLSTTMTTIAELIPFVIAALVILVVGWIVGRILGKIGAMFVSKTGIEEKFSKTPLIKALDESSCSLSSLVDYLIRIVVYLLAIMSAADTLEIQSLQNILSALLAYIPHIIAFILILFIGLLLVDYLADFMAKLGESSNVEFIRPVVLLLRLFLYFVVVMLALTQLNLDLNIIYAFVIPLSWGISLGIGGAIALFFGWGLKEKSPEFMDTLLGHMKPKE